MKKLKSYYMQQKTSLLELKWIFPLTVGSILTLLLLFLTTLTSPDGSSILRYTSISLGNSRFVETALKPLQTPTPKREPLPRLAYFISGSTGDGIMLKRTLEASYHPRNQYVVHLDAEASAEERLDLRSYVETHEVFRRFGNARMIAKANLVTYSGPTMVSNTLHAAAILLKEGGEWDWFINLSATDYPLVTQDDLMHTFTYLPRDLNFIDHTSNIGWKEQVISQCDEGAKPVIVDPGLYMTKKSDVFWVTHAGVCRQLSSSLRDTFTVICNAQEFRNTTVNTDLHFIAWDNPPKQHPHHLNLGDFARMVGSNAPFARKFTKDDPVLDKIDSELLFKGPGMLVPGGWCTGRSENGSDPCSQA